MRARFDRAARRWLLRATERIAPPEVTAALRYRSYARGEGAAFAPRSMTAVDRPLGSSALILSPHPDDEAIGMGGVLAHHLEAGHVVTVIYMTDGRGAFAKDSNLVAVRRGEAEELGRRYRFEQLFWNVPDTRLASDSQSVAALRSVIDRTEPNCIYLPSFFEHAFDHFAANHVLADALREDEALSVEVMGFEVWDNIPFPNYVVDVSQRIEEKTEMLSYYKTPMETTDFVSFCKHRNALHYLLYVDSRRRSPEGYAEAFCRFEGQAFVEVFAEYRRQMQRVGSALPSPPG